MDITQAQTWADIAEIEFPKELKLMGLPPRERPRPDLPAVLETVDLIFKNREKEPDWTTTVHLAAWLAPKFGMTSRDSEIQEALAKIRSPERDGAFTAMAMETMLKIHFGYHLIAFIRENGFADLRALIEATELDPTTP